MDKPSIHVLLVEDNDGDVRLMREWLAESHQVEFEVHRVRSLGESLEALNAQRFDTALVDLSLPDSHGIDTFDRIYRANRHMPIVVLTGLDDEALATEAVKRGAQDYLVKLHLDSSHLLIRSIRYAIERKQLVTELNQRVLELQSRLVEARRSGFQEPYCPGCERLVADLQFWRPLEDYLSEHASAAKKALVCPRCYEQMLRRKLEDFHFNRMQTLYR